MIYLDHHAATPLSDSVREAMANAHREAWANPSSVHRAGRAARRLLEQARRQVAQALDAEPADVVLTAGGTEACNLAVRGLVSDATHVVTTEVEHPAVARAVDRLSQAGLPVTRLALPGGSPPAPEQLDRVLAAHAGGALVALGWVNHETGTVLPIEAYAEVCARRRARLVVDGCQALGKLPVALSGLSALAVASPKIGGPAGAAALWVDRAQVPAPLLDGGSQERGRRPGSLDVSAQTGFGAACEALRVRLAAQPGVARLRDRLEKALVGRGASVNGAAGPRVATVSNVSVPDWRGELLVAALDVEGLCASSGAACSSGLGEPSPVLRAMYPEESWRAAAALRLSLGPETTAGDVDQALALLSRVLARA